ncbi:MAG: FAD-dependent oxidoreductase [Patescibacteria group bacterium]|nr:FAD-dependent oxidoreductase [Patescibacteria group bacterium]
MKKKKKVVVIGAGPAGLGTAFELFKSKNNTLDLLLIDKNDRVGGLARTYKYKTLYFDVGPHRFYTKNKEILQFWKNTLGKDLVKVKRLTRMFYQDKLFLYPVQIGDVISKLGLLTDFKIAFSFFKNKLFRKKKVPVTFEQAIIQDFGENLYKIFFKTYSEKVWGIKCNQISAKWAAQRIKNLNFLEVVKNALGQKNKAKSLIDSFYYPRLGAGQLYEKMAHVVRKNGVQILLNCTVKKIFHQRRLITSISLQTAADQKTVDVDYLFSSMPLSDFILALEPKAPSNVVQAAQKLIFRDHITVNLIIAGNKLFPDNWIYIHSPTLKMARVTNYNNFRKSRQANSSAISVEYFAFQKDKIWQMSDTELIKLATEELVQSNLITKADLVLDGFVIKEAQSYPAYYLGFEKHFATLKSYVQKFSNLQLIGRGGMYKYNNMDHALLSGILAAKNLRDHSAFDVWAINEDAEYLEEAK